jgi:hypothetical protein
MAFKLGCFSDRQTSSLTTHMRQEGKIFPCLAMLKKKPVKGGPVPSSNKQALKTDNGQVKNRAADADPLKKKLKEKRKVQDIEADEGQVGHGGPLADAVKKSKTSAEPQKKPDVGIIGVASGCQVRSFGKHTEILSEWFVLELLVALIKVSTQTRVCAQFESLQGIKPLRPETLLAIKQLGFTNTTPVQQATIPLLLSNKDVAVQVWYL